MEKQVLFDILCAANFTQDDAQQYFAEHRKYLSQSETALPLAYLVGDDILVLPYLKEDYIPDLIGILVGSCIYLLKEGERLENFVNGKRIATSCKISYFKTKLLPSAGMTAKMLHKFNQTVRHLRHHGVEVDFLQGAYWTRKGVDAETQNETNPKVYLLAERKAPRVAGQTTAVMLSVGETCGYKEVNRLSEKKVRLSLDL